jgi:methyl-accepting chemotaxis protein
MKYLTFLDYPTLEATGRSFEAKLNAVVDQKDKEIADLKNKIADLTNERSEQIDRLTQEIEKLKAATRDHVSTQVRKESSSSEGVKVSNELAEMLYKSAKQKIDKAVSKFMREHPEYFEDNRIAEKMKQKGRMIS